MKFRNAIIGLISITFLFLGCDPEKVIPETLFKGFVKPDHFPATHYNFDNNPIDEKKFNLGKKLFYDVRLSRDHTVSCGSCHIQSSAFTQHGHDVSHGVDDRLGRRNSMPIMNLAWMDEFMFDGGVADLDLQPIVPITAHDEMDMDFGELMRFINEDIEYKNLFKEAFGVEVITSDVFLKSLSQFMLMCVSANSKYDKMIKGEETYTELENRGYIFFKTHCNSCHAEPLFSDFSFKNNGIEPGRIEDLGRFGVTLNDRDKYTFKVPSLRNIMLTAPYMHHGQVATIEDVLNHYNSEITNHYGTVHPSLLGRTPAIDMTEDDKTALIAFLKTLTDHEFISRTDLSE